MASTSGVEPLQEEQAAFSSDNEGYPPNAAEQEVGREEDAGEWSDGSDESDGSYGSDESDGSDESEWSDGSGESDEEDDTTFEGSLPVVQPGDGTLYISYPARDWESFPPPPLPSAIPTGPVKAGDEDQRLPPMWPPRRAVAIQRLQQIIDEYLACRKRNEPPTLVLAVRAPDPLVNVNGVAHYRAQRYTYITTNQKVKIRAVLSIIYLLQEGLESCVPWTLRGISYQANLPQRISDEIVSRIVCTIGLKRWHVHVAGAAKGTWFAPQGAVRLLLRNRIVVESRGGRYCELVPNDLTLESVEICLDRVLAVVFVEKEAILNRLSNMGNGCWPLIDQTLFITGKGKADLATRNLMTLIHATYSSLPIHVLADHDVGGVDFFCFIATLAPDVTTKVCVTPTSSG
ncbi:Spo11/DNA topoisomerase VI subunit A [Mycena polygramma]|nr:Spo11/DNA topoisomerase VI subunit A [Mycena polygramma]